VDCRGHTPIDIGIDGRTKVKVSTPGRICLFGEHQDYLHLPVIACAISLRIVIEGQRRSDTTMNIDLPDIGGKETFRLGDKLQYARRRDYFKSAINVMRRKGFRFSTGFDCVVHGEIPIEAGTSSSSALVVGWIHFLSRMSDEPRILSPETIAEYAHDVEVIEFAEAGGMMDHYTTAIGGAVGIASCPNVSVSRFKPRLKPFVLGDSKQQKDTQFVLSRVKRRVLDIVELLRSIDENFSLQTFCLDDINSVSRHLSGDQLQLLTGTIRNRDITHEAQRLFERDAIDHTKIGALLNEQQSILRDTLEISTPKIDAMIEAALSAGAFGAKINGSGDGGCMFAYAPEDPEKVTDAIRRAGGETYIVHVDEGTRIDADS
jgi:galactokinase